MQNTANKKGQPWWLILLIIPMLVSCNPLVNVTLFFGETLIASETGQIIEIIIDTLVKELNSTKDFLSKLSTNLSNDAKQKIETYLNNKVVEVLKNAFENNKTLESNISKIADNSLFFKQVLESDQKHLRAYKKIVGYKALILSSIIGIFLGFFASTFFYKYNEIGSRIENFSDLNKAIEEKRVRSTLEDFKIVLVLATR